ncbi:hypothetical protein [Gaetbulibacter aestuarii]|uniref:Uncharacterized protein n=1 Tax=Gaetbulibacter aestuarii TaxID=1502358 RepID=A0ABW7N2V4_9FLAO
MPKNKRYIFLLILAAALLAIPFIAMQFTPEVAWTASDFLIAGVFLFVLVSLAEVILRKVTLKKYRYLLLVILLFTFLLIWLELAVGIFNTPFAGS